MKSSLGISQRQALAWSVGFQWHGTIGDGDMWLPAIRWGNQLPWPTGWGGTQPLTKYMVLKCRGCWRWLTFNVPSPGNLLYFLFCSNQSELITNYVFYCCVVPKRCFDLLWDCNAKHNSIQKDCTQTYDWPSLHRTLSKSFMPGILCTHLHENFTRMLPESSYLGNSPVALYGQYDVFHIIIRPTMPLMPGRPAQLRSKLWTATFRAGRCWSTLVVKFFPWFPRFLQFRMDVVHSDRNCSALFLVTYSWTLLRSVFSTEASPKSSVRTSRCCEPM